MLRLSGIAAAALSTAAACAGARVYPDAARDIQYAPVDGADGPVLPADAAADAAGDVAPTVDVRPFDGGASASDATLETGRADANTRCTALNEDYVRAVRESLRCMSRGDCAATVCETLCCNCQVFVNPASPSAELLSELQSQWRAAGCQAAMPSCLPTSCEPAASAECSASGRCATIRRPSG